ncbi:hypothetical protein AVV36_gp049 [Pectobacterium bacteriophage PM2]|uniref:Uncharacterized protein n=1 Tax=Pectobacterium bacteriophage PM2 TaxID=1429794 RepID=A0A0A0Q0B0_9CAUD|nr:hypothetical protein AVV36_gp049 [Pectobacterium bacteriophage PM2]AHY25011.1 hypothetical protein PM2_049 [Pectobacterium bacteriophage PM2]
MKKFILSMALFISVSAYCVVTTPAMIPTIILSWCFIIAQAKYECFW